MVPDEIIYKHYDHSVRSYETALMFIDVSGFTDLCEKYTKAGRGGPSRLTQVLNSYIGSMVQEILAYNGDVMKFSGDAFISMWKKTARLSLHEVVHTAIDCGLVVQKNYGEFETDVGVMLKVKIAISAGTSFFSIVGGGESSQASFVMVGQPVWDVKMAEHLCNAGDVLLTPSAVANINEAWYCTQLSKDGKHTKVIGVGPTWKRVKIMKSSLRTSSASQSPLDPRLKVYRESQPEKQFREFSLRPSVVAAMQSSWWPGLRRFMLTPVLRAVDNDEPMDFLSEIRRVVVVFMNIITKTLTENMLIGVVDRAYKCVSSVTSTSGGLVNKVSMFDKDMMFLVVFGLRGLKHEDEAQKALQCAFQFKTSLNDDNIKCVSIGVTSGTTYCGVVGHVLRREYTVIGAAVNKAARLMMAYPNKVTCDKETFLRSKLDQEYFKLMEAKPLKGIKKPGPIYEFNKLRWHETKFQWRHPILGRNEELKNYRETIQNALQQQYMKFTRYRDHKFAIAFSGPRLVGKTRLLEECLNITPNFVRIEKVILNEETKVPYGLFRLIIARTLISGKSKSFRESCENRITYSMDLSTKTPLQIHAINTVFDTRFPLPENFTYSGHLLDEMSVKNIIREICKANYRHLWVLAVEEAQHTDDESWRILLLLLDTKTIFVVMTITDNVEMTKVASNCLANNMIVKIILRGIDKWYHAALACQLLDVQVIPADLQKVIESASGGLPGWIQNFLISLVQRGVLTIVTLTRAEAQSYGGIMPSHTLLQRASNDDDIAKDNVVKERMSYQSIISMETSGMGKIDSTFRVLDHGLSDTVQMAVLAENFSSDDVTVDMTMDAVAKLFSIRVLECEGGDFTRDTSLVLVHPAPVMPAAKPPYCACLGIRQPSNCTDIPMYAFCGYMRFRHSLFRTTTYELLTENQKQEMHARALIYLERYTKRCYTCGFGCFTKLLGVRCEDGLVDESVELKRTRAQIVAISAETRTPGELDRTSAFMVDDIVEVNLGDDMMRWSSYDKQEEESVILGSRVSRQSNVLYERYRKDKRVRSFSSLELNSCECLQILLFVYCQIIDHCRGAGEDKKLYEAYLEYASLSIMSLNIPQAIRLLFEVEMFVQTHSSFKMDPRQQWMMNFQLARIRSLRGVCLLESGDLNEARTLLLDALELYEVPFPTGKRMVRLANFRASWRQKIALSIAPNRYIATEKGIIGCYFDDIASTLNHLYTSFSESNEYEKATLAAKLSFSYALKTNSNFSVLCFSYGNMIFSYKQLQKFNQCLKLEKRALELCHRKRGILDVTEVKGVCYLYTNIFLFYMEYGKKLESLEFGLSVMRMMTNLIDTHTRQMLLISMLKLLLSDLRINDMVVIMREFFYMSDFYDLSSETWYYYYAIVILLDTGYCVESYEMCERFYIKKGQAIMRWKTTAAGWNFIVIMWLMTIRNGVWEKSILWEDKILQITSMKPERNDIYFMMLARLIEGLLITLVKEINSWNLRKIVLLEKSLKEMLKELANVCKQIPMYRPRYFYLQAYYQAIKGKKSKAMTQLGKALDWAKQCSQGCMVIACEHTKKHWKGTLNPKNENYWMEHTQGDNLLDYRDYVPEKSTIIPYTLPLPIRDFEKN